MSDGARRAAKAKSLPEKIRARFGWISISLSAFIMSVTATLISAYYGLQGAEIVVQPPKQLLLYRDGEGENSVLSAAMRVEMINTASDYGDVLIDASFTPVPGGPDFEQQGLVTPAFSQNAQEAAKGCELGASCIGLPGLLIVQRSDQVMDLSGGSARVVTPYFWLSDSGCTSTDKRRCASFSSFDRAVTTLAKRPIEVRMTLRFHSDGERRMVCRGTQLDAAYLRAIGWTQLACQEASVSGAPLL